VARLDWQLKKRLSACALPLRGSERGCRLFGQNFNKYNVGVGFRYDYALGL
jgi:hypothetical protein